MKTAVFLSLVALLLAGCVRPVPYRATPYNPYDGHSYGPALYPTTPYRQPSAGLTGYAEQVIGETIHFNPCRGKPRNVRRSYGASASVSVDDYYGVEVDRDYYGRTSGECP